MFSRDRFDAVRLLILFGVIAFLILRSAQSPAPRELTAGLTAGTPAEAGQASAGGGGNIPPGPQDASQDSSSSGAAVPAVPFGFGAWGGLISELDGAEGGIGVPLPADLLPPLLRQPSVSGDNAPRARQSSPSSRIGRALSDEEIFQQLWPESYRRRLQALENMVILDGQLKEIDPAFFKAATEPPSVLGPPIREWLIPPEKRHSAFRSDADIYAALLNIVEEKHEAGLTTAEALEKSRWAITVALPRVIELDRARLRQGLSRLEFARPEEIAAKCTGSRNSIGGFFRSLAAEFTFLKPALAGWTTSPDCYKDDDPKFQPLGSNSSVGCCNCGLYCTTKGCVPVSDCGAGGKFCNVQLGCLNGVCAEWPNAIWDKDTEICGCG